MTDKTTGECTCAAKGWLPGHRPECEAGYGVKARTAGAFSISGVQAGRRAADNHGKRLGA